MFVCLAVRINTISLVIFPVTTIYFRLEMSENNFPDILKTNFLGQAVEIARQCVQPPLKKKPK